MLSLVHSSQRALERGAGSDDTCLAFGATSHVMVQRALAARSVHEARICWPGC